MPWTLGSDIASVFIPLAQLPANFLVIGFFCFSLILCFGSYISRTSPPLPCAAPGDEGSPKKPGLLFWAVLPRISVSERAMAAVGREGRGYPQVVGPAGPAAVPKNRNAKASASGFFSCWNDV